MGVILTTYKSCDDPPSRASSWLPRHQQKKCHCRACSWQVQAFVQLLVKRKCRSKPLLELKCLGCSSTTFDRCRFIPCDVFEWAPGFLKMKQLGVSEEQPTGALCADCHHTGKMGFPALTLLYKRRYAKTLLMTSDIIYTNFQGDTHQPSPTIKDHVDLLGCPWKLVKG